MTADEFRRLALTLPAASEAAHMGHPDFRVGGKIFATLAPDEASGMVKLTPDQQTACVREAPEVFQPVNGAWGCRGCTTVRLESATTSVVQLALAAAWRNTAPKRLLAQVGKTSPVKARASRSKATRRTHSSAAVTDDAVTYDTVRQLALALPGAEEGTSYGTAAVKVRGTLFVRLHQSREAIVIKIDPRERAIRMRADPETFFITDHYVGHPLMLVRFATTAPDDLKALIEESWRRSAPPKLLAEYDGR
jgi:hypothetical protein